MNLKQYVLYFLCIVCAMSCVVHGEGIPQKLMNLNNQLLQLHDAVSPDVKMQLKCHRKTQPQSLRNIRFPGAGVLPYFTEQVGNEKHRKYVFSRERWGQDKGTWESFSGKRDSGEGHPVVTAAREFHEESAGLFFPDVKTAKKYIDIDTGNTSEIIVKTHARKNRPDFNTVTYLTEFSENKIQDFTLQFYQKLNELDQKNAPSEWREKDRIAIVDEKSLKHAIKTQQPPVFVEANVVYPMKKRGVTVKERIQLRNYFARHVKPFLEGVRFESGKHQNIRFYNKH